MSTDRAKSVRRTTVFLALVAIGFYAGFILMGVMKA